MYRLTWTAILIGSGAAVAFAAQPSASAVYLTWQRDPATTMTVHWLAPRDAGPTAVQCRPDDRDRPWRRATSDAAAMPGDDDLLVHTAEFTGLQPDTLYRMRLDGDERVFRFRTMPDSLSRPIRFAVGGDVYKQRDHVLSIMCRRVAERDVDFIVFGGDICNANGDPSNAPLWTHFFRLLQEHMAAEGNRLIPIIPAIGNHEVSDGGFNRAALHAPFFYALFAFPGEPGYGVLDFGDYLSILCLDSEHTNPVVGVQSDWLTETLAARVDVPHVTAVYHVPAWPSVRHPMNLHNRRVRHGWTPIFEDHGLDFAFEHHDHAYKRTHPIRDEKIDARGVVYFGDGGFGQGKNRVPRSPGSWLSGGRWYLSASGSASHFHLVTIDGPTRHFEAIDASGRVFDSYAMTAGIRNTILNNPAQLDLQPLIWIGVGTAGSLLAITLGLIDRHRKIFHGPKKQALAFVRGIRNRPLRRTDDEDEPDHASQAA